MTFIERIARHLDPALWESVDRTPASQRLRLQEDAIEISKRRAREIMRELQQPTNEMCAAGEAVICNGRDDRFAEAWNAALDVAMREG